MFAFAVMSRGAAVMNGQRGAAARFSALTRRDGRPDSDESSSRMTHRERIPAPLLFVIATAFGVSSTFQAYWLDAISHEHAMPHALLHLFVLNLVYWYIPAL